MQAGIRGHDTEHMLRVLLSVANFATLLQESEVRPIELTIGDVIGWIEQLAPRDLAEEWDAVGLQIGDPRAPVRRVITALTLTSNVVEQAKAFGAQLIVAHHPLIFRPLKSIQHRTRVGSIVTALIKNDIALYAAHTNLDAAVGGVNDGLANRLGLVEVEPLVPAAHLRRYKLVTFVPVEHEAEVRDALAEAGAGIIGNYSHCAFSTQGWGSFKPLAGADPYIGEVGKVERVQEVRLEMVVDHHARERVIDALWKAHPYEEVAYDLYPIEGGRSRAGLGRIGRFPEPMALSDFLAHVADALLLDDVRLAGASKEKVQRVAVVGGSGGSFVTRALQLGADVLITGDVDYHDADEARHGGLLVVDAGHFGTEKHVPHDLKTYLDEEAGRRGATLHVQVAGEEDAFWQVKSSERERC